MVLDEILGSVAENIASITVILGGVAVIAKYIVGKYTKALEEKADMEDIENKGAVINKRIDELEKDIRDLDHRLQDIINNLLDMKQRERIRNGNHF